MSTWVGGGGGGEGPAKPFSLNEPCSRPPTPQLFWCFGVVASAMSPSAMSPSSHRSNFLAALSEINQFIMLSSGVQYRVDKGMASGHNRTFANHSTKPLNLTHLCSRTHAAHSLEHKTQSLRGPKLREHQLTNAMIGASGCSPGTTPWVRIHKGRSLIFKGTWFPEPLLSRACCFCASVRNGLISRAQSGLLAEAALGPTFCLLSLL